MKIPKYSRCSNKFNYETGEGYFNFGGEESVKTSDKLINIFIEECVGELLVDKTLDYACRATGDTEVLVFRFCDSDDGTEEFEINVSHGRRTCSIFR